MELPVDLIKQFVDITNDSADAKDAPKITHQAKAVVNDDGIFVRIDGSNSLTPVSMATDARDGDTVLVRIENHKAYITSNLTSPGSGRGATDVEDNLNASFDVVSGKYGVFEEIRASKEYVDTLIAGDVSADRIVADSAKIQDLDADKLSAATAYIDDLTAKNITSESITSDHAVIESLDSTYADIDFANVLALEASQAIIQNLLVGGGIITDDITAVTGQFTKYLTGVNISGDLIKAGTISTERLIIRSTDTDEGILYAINDAGELDQSLLSPEELKRLTLDGKLITAGTITADKIAVTDLSAFNATIGGFNITENSLYSGVKESVNNPARGVYLDNTGQIAFGDSTNYLKYFEDEDGNWKLDVSASAIKLGASQKTVEEYIEEKAVEVSGNVAAEAATPVLRIDSSRGTVFKNNAVSTVLTVSIYRGGDRITDMAGLTAAFGNTAYLQWYWQRLDEDKFGVISLDDSRISNGGFVFTLTPDDVDVKVTFMCELIAE